MTDPALDLETLLAESSRPRADPERPPAKSCGICGGSGWWWSHGRWLCGVCHPDPSALGKESQDSGQGKAADGSGRGFWYELKMINGYGPYKYRRWREGGRLRSKYLGKAKTDESAGR